MESAWCVTYLGHQDSWTSLGSETMWITALYLLLLSVLSVCALQGTGSTGATVDIQKRETRFGRVSRLQLHLMSTHGLRIQ